MKFFNNIKLIRPVQLLAPLSLMCVYVCVYECLRAVYVDMQHDSACPHYQRSITLGMRCILTPGPDFHPIIANRRSLSLHYREGGRVQTGWEVWLTLGDYSAQKLWLNDLHAAVVLLGSACVARFNQ